MLLTVKVGNKLKFLMPTVNALNIRVRTQKNFSGIKLNLKLNKCFVPQTHIFNTHARIHILSRSRCEQIIPKYDFFNTKL